MGFSAIIPIDQMDTANATLKAQGFGPENFSVPLRGGVSDTEATHAGLNMLADHTAFKAAVEAIPNVSIREAAPATVEFAQHVAAEALDWSDPTNWTENPVMAGDQRTFGGVLWVSLVDFNVWQHPVNWREAPVTGYPAWVQPTGAADAYAAGDRVQHSGSNWENNTPANVWEPPLLWDKLV